MSHANLLLGSSTVTIAPRTVQSSFEMKITRQSNVPSSGTALGLPLADAQT
jgi:hypothetical protein